jgi:hypothetical protein
MSLIQKGQHVRCILKNNLLLEGIVDSWSETISVIKSKDGLQSNVILNTLQDVMVVKIIHKQPTQLKTELEQQFAETVSAPSNDDLRLKKMAELKSLLAEQEKKIVTEKLRSHQIGEVKKVNYEYPRFRQK